MRVNVTESEMACILYLRQACFHNGHEHRELWVFGLRDILGRTIPVEPGNIDFSVSVNTPSGYTVRPTATAKKRLQEPRSGVD